MDYTSRPTDIETVRLDECEGTLRRDVPADLRLADGAFVVLRRYISGAEARAFQLEMAAIQRRLQQPGAAWKSDEQIEAEWQLTNKRVVVRVTDYRLYDVRGVSVELTPETIDELPSPHRNALIDLVVELEQPRRDEDAFRAAQERRSRAVGRNGHDANDGVALLDGSLVAAGGPALSG